MESEPENWGPIWGAPLLSHVSIEALLPLWPRVCLGLFVVATVVGTGGTGRARAHLGRHAGVSA